MAYDLKPLKAPTLRGRRLRMCTAALESRLLRPAILPSLLRKAGVSDFRKLGPNAEPTTVPLVEPPDTEPTEHEGPAAAERIAAESPPGEPAELALPSVLDYASAYRDRATTPLRVAEAVVRAVEASQRPPLPLGAIVACDAADVIKQAKESTARIADGRPRGILEGVPVAIKDEFDMPPYPTRVGTRFLGRELPTEDATAVARLRAAGAVLIGKANMFEIGISPTGNSPVGGFARNPHDPQHDAGGSSGGCGAAVGSGMVPLALGSDGGGSIRVPASHCGIFGLKPTYGRVSEAGAAPLCWSVAHIGPIGVSAIDTAIGYAICAGRDPKDPMTLKQPPPHLRRFHDLDLSGLKVGVYRPWFEDASPEIVACCDEVLRHLESAGAERKEVEIEGLEAARVAHAVTILTEMATAMDPYYSEHRKDFGHNTRLSLALARQFTGTDYVLAQRIRSQAMRTWRRALSEVDVVVTPTTACPPPHIAPSTLSHGESDMRTQTELMRFVIAANFCGLPAISCPAGYTAAGLPVGLQIIGDHWQEAELLRIANVIDHQVPRRKPATCFEPLASGS